MVEQDRPDYAQLDQRSEVLDELSALHRDR
jgi:hypothetical protein